MRYRLTRLAQLTYIFFLLNIDFVYGGLNHFTEKDIYKEWIIEQKFDSEKNQVFCRASIKGYGTWFGQRIRLDRKGKLVYPSGISSKSPLRENDLKYVRKLLEKCRSSLLYIPEDIKAQ
ncbi:hypothetical protein [Prochlorococcus marinus]|uniref:hypothetical protein n=1 Tax=Prochlorococcus marinus TaxID=1219 RepID=UPI0022B4AADB|nr:hypothetical protein [Prochlorococcus marinus]